MLGHNKIFKYLSIISLAEKTSFNNFGSVYVLGCLSMQTSWFVTIVGVSIVNG